MADGLDGIAADPIRFEEAIKALRRRVPMTDEAFAKLVAEEREFAFTVADVAELDLVADVYEAIERAVRDGTTVEDFKADVGEQLERAWGGDDDGRLECLPGDNLVTGAVIGAAHRRWFEGNICEVTTGRGRRFTATPNHPMLTIDGWKAAGELRKGDDLVGYNGEQHPGPRREHHEAQPPPTISEVFAALAHPRNVKRIRGHRLDFHGDGRDGDVDIVRPARMLVNGAFASIRQPLEHLVFSHADLSRPRFCSRCQHLNLVTERCGFCARAVRQTSPLKAYADRVVAGIEVVRERIRAFTREVARHQVVNGDISALPGWFASPSKEQRARGAATTRDASLFYDRRDPAIGTTNQGFNLRDAEASEIEFDNVRAVNIRSFRGHVFNLSTQHGYYLLGGLYTGNTIFRTNTQTAYNAGRYAEATAPAVAEDRPYWRFDAIVDDRTTDEICRKMDGTCLPADHDWWRSRYPPNHFNCRSIVTTLTEEQARDNGVTGNPTGATAMPGFGKAPSVRGSDWSPPDPEEYPEPMVAEAEERLG